YRPLRDFYRPLSLFVHVCAPRLDLPSFPTRRSSDLGHRDAVRRCLAGGPRKCADFHPDGALTCYRLGGRRSGRRIDSWAYAVSRSEEHTSELQSRFDLVCRLLLEKKKQRKNKHES